MVAHRGGAAPDGLRWLDVVADGAPWIWPQVQALLPQAQQVLDDDHCAHHVHAVATAHYRQSLQALAWHEATMTRL